MLKYYPNIWGKKMLLREKWNEAFRREITYVMRLYNVGGYSSAIILDTLNDLTKFDAEIHTNYNANDTKIFISYWDFEWLCRRYIKRSRKKNNKLSGYVFFHLFEALRFNYKKENEKFVLNSVNNFLVPIKEKEQQFIFNIIGSPLDSFKDIQKVKFKGLTLYYYHDELYLIQNEEVSQIFPAVYDWWFPLEKYIFLQRCWKEEDKNKVKLF